MILIGARGVPDTGKRAAENLVGRQRQEEILEGDMQTRSKISLWLVLSSLLLLLIPASAFAQKSAPSGGSVVDPPSICDTVSSNLVLNCGFETGTFAHWTTTPAASGSDFGIVSGVEANSGSYAAAFGAVGSLDDSISQTLTTSAGGTYTVSFYLTNSSSPSTGQANFYAYWDGTQIFSASGSAFPYTQFSFTETGVGSDTLTFAGLQVPAWYYLDDVVVTSASVPEPNTLSLLAVGLLGLGALTFLRVKQAA